MSGVALVIDLQPWVTLVACLTGVMFAASAEAALVGITEARVRAAVADKIPGAQRLHYWLSASGRILTTLHLLRLSCVTAAALVGWNLVLRSVPELPIFAFATVFALVVLVVGHLVPRTFAKHYALRWGIGVIRLVRGIALLLLPVTYPLGSLVRAIARLVGGSTRFDTAFWTPDEIGRLAVEAEADALGKRGKELLHSIIEFSDTLIREIMVPRTEMVAIEAGCSPGDLMRIVVEAGHSRVPVYDESIDNIVGILHVKDLFNAFCALPPGATPPVIELRASVRAAFYVPEVMQISELLREFQRRKTHMAIVVDEYGGTAGVVTLEDIIEEIVGDIQDEYDVDEKQFRVLGDNKIIADGRVAIWEIEQALAVDFPEDGDYETLAGFLMSRAGYLPRTGTVIGWGPLRFTIKEANEKRIGMVEIERREVGAVRA